MHYHSQFGRIPKDIDDEPSGTCHSATGTSRVLTTNTELATQQARRLVYVTTKTTSLISAQISHPRTRVPCTSPSIVTPAHHTSHTEHEPTTEALQFFLVYVPSSEERRSQARDSEVEAGAEGSSAEGEVEGVSESDCGETARRMECPKRTV